MNTKGIKFLAVLAVLAMAFAAVAVVANSDDSSATGKAVSTKWKAAGGAETMGPLDFATTGFNSGGLNFDNEDLGNNIVVAYDAASKTYKVTGTLGFNANEKAETDVLKKLDMPTTDHYALAFLAVHSVDKDFTIKVGNIGRVSGTLTDNEDCILSFSKPGKAPVVITTSEGATTYTIDYSSVSLSPSADKNPTGFVGLKAYNADVKINVSGKYNTASNEGLGNSVTIKEVDKSASDLYAEYTVDAKLAYNEFNKAAKGMDYSGTEFKYALIYQITGLKAYDNNLGVTLPFGQKFSADGKEWYSAIASEDSNAQETFALYFKAVPSTSSSSAYIYFGPAVMNASSDVASAAKIKINFNVSMIAEEQTTIDANEVKAALDKTSNKIVQLNPAADVTFVAGTKVLDNQTLIITAGTNKITGDLTIGTGSDAKKVTFTNVQGTVEISKGSVKIFGNPWSAGTITLYNNDVAKISGEVGDVTFAYGDDSGKATILIEKDTSLSIQEGKTLTIGNNKISMEVAGTLNGKGTLANGSSGITVSSGAVIEGVKISGTANITVYSGSDINLIDTVDATKLKGKDAASGSWYVDGTELKLVNYNGTYNFHAFAGSIKTIVLVGDNVVKYSANDKYYLGSLFGDGTVTLNIEPETNTGSLAVEADLSGANGDALASGFAVFDATAVSLDQASVDLAIKGTNNAWTDDQKKSALIYAIDTDSLILNNSQLVVDIASTFGYEEAGKVVGIASKLTTPEILATGADISLTTSNLEVTSIDAAIVGDSVNVTNYSEIIVNGIMAVGLDMTVKNSSTVSVSNALAARNLVIKTESSVTTKDLVILGTGGENLGELNILGDTIIEDDAGFTNTTEMTNSGKMAVFGAFINKGQFNNSGDIIVPNKIGKKTIGQTIAFTNDASKIGATAVMIDIITVDVDEPGIDGISKIKNATVKFKRSDASVTGAIPYTNGTLTPAIDGSGYTLYLENSDSKITVVYKDSAESTKKVGKEFVVTVSGTAMDTTAKNIVANLADTVGTESVFTNGLALTNGYIQVKEGATLKSTGSITVASNDTTPVNIVVSDGKIEGDITASVGLTIAGTLDGNITSSADVTVSGTMNGDIMTEGAVTVSKTLKGNITTKTTVDITGTVTGDITAASKVTVSGTLTGNVDITPAAATTFVVSNGTVDGILTYNYEYTATKGSDVKSTGAVMMDIIGKGTYTINLNMPVNSDSTKDGEPGYFTIASAPAIAVPENSTLTLALTEGKMIVDTSLNMPVGSTLVIEKDTYFEVNLGQYIDVKTSALKVADGANVKMNLETDSVPEYGVVKFEMNFTTSDGYTVYSDVASALELCDEGSTLAVGSSSTISKSIEVKKGVNIIVKNVTLTFAGKDVKMGDGAKFTIEGTGTMIFQETSQDLTGKEYVYFTVSATVVYDEENVIVFEGVRFTGDSTLAGIAATDAAASKLSIDIKFDEGAATISSGIANGSAALSNDSYAVTKADDASGVTTPCFATLAIDEGAIFEANSITDAYGVVLIDTDGKSVKNYVKLATAVLVSGTLSLVNDTEIKGTYAGEGDVVVAAGKKVVLKESEAPAASTNRNVEPIVAVTIIDSTDDANGYVLAFASPAVTKTLTLTAAGSNLMTIGGFLGSGAISATTTAVLDGLTIEKDAELVADAVKLIADSDATGQILTKTLDLNSKKLTYDTTFEFEGYTAYTKLESLTAEELSEIGSIVIEQNNYALPASITGDITITIKEGNVAIVATKTIVGTAPTSLGAGTVLIGKISVATGAYLIVYPTADISGATIVGNDKKTAAASSAFDIDGTLYATAYANDGDKTLNSPAADLKPAIAGYTFTAWSTYNTVALDTAKIGETNVTGALVAGKVTVTAKYAAGVAYYLNGVEFGYTDMPYKVSVGDVFTAKIVDYSKYEGTPLVNGKTSFVVTEDATLTISGVAPIPAPEPTPEPEKDNGITLTEILLIVLIVLCAVMVIVVILRLNRS